MTTMSLVLEAGCRLIAKVIFNLPVFEFHPSFAHVHSFNLKVLPAGRSAS